MATWALDPAVTHLNHGSFGACPTEVLNVQAGLRSEMERNPVSFMLYEYQPLLEVSRSALASFVHADPDGLVFVPNATYGANSVLRSLEAVLPRGGEILLTNQTYNACSNAATVTAERIGGSVVVVDVPFPIESSQSVIDSILAAVTDRTALVMLDHVTSPTGLVWPVEEITRTLEPDVPVLIDGAHAPGMLELDLTEIGASFYTANCHKWICGPKGSAFLHVAERHRDDMRAAVISHGYNDGWPESGSRFHAQFDWTGTDDPTARLSVASAIEVMGTHRDGGWDAVRATNHDLVLEGRAVIADVLGIDTPAPSQMIGSIASLPLPTPTQQSDSIFDSLMGDLHERWKIEVPVFSWPEAPERVIRISAQQYNTIDDYSYLADALRAELS
jgi:isopenicillin-N epimerase